MLAIRLQRHGRKDLPKYRLIVQEASRHPSSGRVVARAGNHDPRSKTTAIDRDTVSFYLRNGARPSDRVIRLLKDEKIELPEWVEPTGQKQRTAKHPDKLRKNQSKEAAPATAESAGEVTPGGEDTVEATSAVEASGSQAEAADA